MNAYALVNAKFTWWIIFTEYIPLSIDLTILTEISAKSNDSHIG